MSVGPTALTVLRSVVTRRLLTAYALCCSLIRREKQRASHTFRNASVSERRMQYNFSTAEDKMDRNMCYDKFSTFYNENDEDIELDDWVPPDGDLVKKMVSQIEYYLSDENLSKDAFLLKHVRRNTMGYVNIKLLTSFKKMKHLSKDWRITAYALRHSAALIVNEEGTKVRRIDPVPESVLAQVPSRLLLVWNLPEPPVAESVPALSRTSMEIAISILEPFGPITTVRVNRPGRELPAEIQRYSHRYPELSSQESVLVEYEDLDGAGRAHHQLAQSDSSLKVLLVGRPSKKKAGVDEERNGKGVAILNRRMEQLQCLGEDSSACSSSESDFNSSSPLPIPRFPSCQKGSSPWGSPRSSPRSSPRVLHAPLLAPRVSPLLAADMWPSPDTSPEMGRRNLEQTSASSNAAGNPWMQRRKLAVNKTMAKESGRQGRMGAKRALNGDTLPPGVLRLPHGPDGSRGFHITIVGKRLHHPLKI